MIELTAEETFKYGAAVAGGAYGFYVGIKRILKKMKKRENRCTSCNLCRHKLFALMDLWLKESESTTWKCCNDYKTAVAKKLVEIKLKSGKEDIKSFVCRIDKSAEPEYIKIEFNKMILDMIRNYENAWIAAGVNDMIVSRISAYHNMNAKKAIHRFNIEMDSEFLSITERLNHGLNTLISPYNDFMYDVRLVLNGVNGELKGDVFSGIINDGKRIKTDTSLLAASRDDIIG